MKSDHYFYAQESDTFSFIRVPYVIVHDKQYGGIDPTAKLLYGDLLSRMELSKKNKWIDRQHRVFIIYTVQEICDTFRCKRDKAMKLLRQLEQADLIDRTHQGVGRADRIYVKKFVRVENSDPMGR